MWKSEEYCTFSFNWECNHDPGYLVSYSIVKDMEEWTSSIPELLRSSPKLDCNTNEEQPAAPELRIICKPYNRVKVHGIDVISDARVIEVYSDIDGYLKSCRGEVVDDIELDDSGQKSNVVNCRFSLDEPLNSVSLKFVGLDERSTLKIHSLHLALVQCMDTNSGREGSIDLNRVRSYLNSMGDAIPNNARDLLNSVEQFQQTQMLGLSSIQAALSSSKPQNGQAEGLDLLAGLLSKFTSMDMSTNASSRSRTNGIALNKSREKSTHPQTDSSDSAFSPLDRLLQKSLTSEDEGHLQQKRQGEGQDDMYKMLQGICGSVSAIRQKSQQEDSIQTNKKSEEKQEKLSDNLEAQGSQELPDMNKVIKQTVSHEFEKCEQRLKEYVDTSLVAMETRMNSKLDKMIELLSKSSDS